jgi:Methyltransferase domain/Glycosyl transferase family 2
MTALLHKNDGLRLDTEKGRSNHNGPNSRALGAEPMTSLLDNRGKKEYKVYAISMIRNDADIIRPFLAHLDELFDKILLVDVQSTDGTLESIASFAAASAKVELYTVNMQERYQSAIMNRLSRIAFSQGADWVFLLDADEFVNIEDNQSFQSYLRAFPDELIYLPWINLVPSEYGTYASFNISQHFFWRGRTSIFKKVALSSLFALNNPDYYIHEGNHAVSRDFKSPPCEPNGRGLPLFHLPIRSPDRFKYKVLKARQKLRSKHNKLAGEGSHVEAIGDLLRSGPLGTRQLNSIAADYGCNAQDDAVDPANENWPIITLPQHVLPSEKYGCVKQVDLSDTLINDKTITWERPCFPEGAAVGAAISGNKIKIVPQPMTGGGNLYDGPFPAFADHPQGVAPAITPQLLIDALTASFVKPEILTFSAWSELVPALFSLFSIIRPRRFVELGTHNGMCFFAACQASKVMNLDTQCIAIDNWIGDPHASFHSKDVFNNFATTIRDTYPDQFYIKANFEHALECFDEQSIDLLHIDGFHTYEAVKADFDGWLPKMSSRGVVLLHDINVHERGFGVWRLWDELKTKYPSFALFHSHGLGIVLVGRQPSVFSEAVEALQTNLGLKQIVRAFYESIGPLSVENRRAAGQQHMPSSAFQHYMPSSETEIENLRQELTQCNYEKDVLRRHVDELLASRSWRVTGPARRIKTALRAVAFRISSW